ncbi:hypothetical protein C4J83_1491 [Pseudomonas sp. LBUM920]|nr:hypothetical protein C4J83_1491 [Pseudomonas sp. LBUM920]
MRWLINRRQAQSLSCFPINLITIWFIKGRPSDGDFLISHLKK